MFKKLVSTTTSLSVSWSGMACCFRLSDFWLRSPNGASLGRARASKAKVPKDRAFSSAQPLFWSRRRPDQQTPCHRNRRSLPHTSTRTQHHELSMLYQRVRGLSGARCPSRSRARTAASPGFLSFVSVTCPRPLHRHRALSNT